MIEKINLENILFLDIETVPEAENFNILDEDKKHLFDQKTQYQRKDDYTPEEFYDRAGIWAEFGKIVCISVGYFTFTFGQKFNRIASFINGEGEPLVDASQYEIMKANFVITKAMTPEERKKFDLKSLLGKFCMVNITHSEDYSRFCTRYADRQIALQTTLDLMTPEKLREWVHALGVETFVGTSGRVFPKALKASPLLRAWLARLRPAGRQWRRPCAVRVRVPRCCGS